MKKKATLLSIVFAAFVLMAFAKQARAKEIIEIPVIVNVHDGTTFTDAQVSDMVDRINKILKPAGIKLVHRKTNRGVKVGNDGKLDMGERNEARKKGYEEIKGLDENKGKRKYKGCKINICETPVAEDPNYVGQALHRCRVVLISPDKDNDPNITAATAAHELVHAMTVCGDKNDPNDQGHSADPNDLMYKDIEGGTNLRPSDVNEIQDRAKKWGNIVKVTTAPTDEQAKAGDDGKTSKMKASGGQIDSFFDVFVSLGDPGLFDPNDPLFHYADIGEIILYCEEPFAVPAAVQVEFLLNGALSELSSHVIYTLNMDFDPGIPGPERYINFDVTTNPGVDPVANADIFEAGGAHLGSFPVDILEDPQLDEGPKKTRLRHTLMTEIPPDFFGPGSEPFNPPEPNLSAVSFVESDERLPAAPGTMQLTDEVETFSFGLENPAAGPRITVSRAFRHTSDIGEHWIFGSGFEPDLPVQLHICPHGDMLPIDIPTTADTDGNLQIEIIDPIGINGGFDIAAVGSPDATGAILYATGYFSDAPLDADLDTDGDVDLTDFATFANQWLEVDIYY